MTISATLVARPITLDQLVALSDEIAALARAGVPLDRGLQDLAHDLPGRLGRISGEMGKKLEQGQPLEKVVAELGASLPPAYQTVIAAGQRVGRLPAALEDVARTARRVSQLRWAIGLALIYPIVLLLFAWGMLAFVLLRITPVMMRMMLELGLVSTEVVEFFDRVQATEHVWGPLMPLPFVAWAVWVWYQSGRVAGGVELNRWLSMGAVGTLARLQRAGRIASLAELLALLVSHETPLPEAVELASSAVGSRSIAKGGRELAARLRAGEKSDLLPDGFPPLVAWTLVSSSSPTQLVRALKRMAEVHRDELKRRGQWLSLYIPLVLTAGVGGTIVLIYAMLTLLPWILILYRLAEPV